MRAKKSLGWAHRIWLKKLAQAKARNQTKMVNSSQGPLRLKDWEQAALGQRWFTWGRLAIWSNQKRPRGLLRPKSKLAHFVSTQAPKRKRSWPRPSQRRSTFLVSLSWGTQDNLSRMWGLSAPRFRRKYSSTSSSRDRWQFLIGMRADLTRKHVCSMLWIFQRPGRLWQPHHALHEQGGSKRGKGFDLSKIPVASPCLQVPAVVGDEVTPEERIGRFVRLKERRRYLARG